MATQSLYERHLEKLRSEENWADKPVEMFASQARNQLMKVGHRIDEADPLHVLAIAGRAREIRDCLAQFCAYVDLAHAVKIKAKGGRPPKDYFEIVILAAAFYRCQDYMPGKSEAQLCREAAKALGERITAKVVSDALKQLPRIALGLQSQLGTDASPEGGVRMLLDLLRATGKALRDTNRELKAEAKQAEANRKSGRFAPVLVCSNSAG
jgi:hypothetical protein